MVRFARITVNVPRAAASGATLLLVSALSVCACSSDASSDAASGAEGAAANPNDSAACRTPLVAPGELVERQLEHDGVLREYLLYVGAGVELSEPAPLLLNFHGFTSNPERQRRISDMDRVADERGFVVAYPQGISKSFNGGSCCGQAVSPANDADDIGFSRAIVQDVGRQLCVDERRVYSTGMSNGGYMSEYNGCKSADLFAAIAPVSALAVPQPSCDPARPVPFIAFNGTDDSLASYEGSRESIAAWVERNDCSGESTREHYGESFCDVWKECASGVEVIACTLAEMPHCWPGSTENVLSSCDAVMDIDATEMIWAFFERFALPD